MAVRAQNLTLLKMYHSRIELRKGRAFGTCATGTGKVQRTTRQEVETRMDAGAVRVHQ